MGGGYYIMRCSISPLMKWIDDDDAFRRLSHGPQHFLISHWQIASRRRWAHADKIFYPAPVLRPSLAAPYQPSHDFVAWHWLARAAPTSTPMRAWCDGHSRTAGDRQHLGGGDQRSRPISPTSRRCQATMPPRLTEMNLVIRLIDELAALARRNRPTANGQRGHRRRDFAARVASGQVLAQAASPAPSSRRPELNIIRVGFMAWRCAAKFHRCLPHRRWCRDKAPKAMVSTCSSVVLLRAIAGFVWRTSDAPVFYGHRSKSMPTPKISPK